MAIFFEMSREIQATQGLLRNPGDKVGSNILSGTGGFWIGIFVLDSKF